MEKPKVFQNIINKKIDNNNDYYMSNIKKKIDNRSINTKINEMFKSSSFIYKIDALIVLKDKEIKKRIIGKNNNNLITIDNEVIPINEIIDIKYTS